MVPQPRGGSFSPTPSAHSLQTGTSHSPRPSISQAGIVSAGASPNINSPTGNNSLTKIVVAQVYLLLGALKDDRDRSKWASQVEQLRKLVDENGMEVFSKYFARLIAGNASQIFPGMSRQTSSAVLGNYQLIADEMARIAILPDQARKIAEAIETGSEDIFRDFDLSTFMDHFKLDPLEKTILALAFKVGTRSDLKTKVDAILSANFTTFADILSRSDGPHNQNLTPDFVSLILDRFMQYPPPSFNAISKGDLAQKALKRYVDSPSGQAPPSEVLAALDLGRLLTDAPSNALALYMQKSGVDFTKDEASCTRSLRNRPQNVQLNESQVATALLYATISQSPEFKPAVLIASLRKVVTPAFNWSEVPCYFDQKTTRVSSGQFLILYRALLPIAQDSSIEPPLNLQKLWGDGWENTEANLSFVCAFASLSPETLDATTIPRLVPTITLDTYSESSDSIKNRAEFAVRHPLVSASALSAVFHAALNSLHASQSMEAKRLFQEVVIPNLDLFVVSAFGVPKPWPAMAVETLGSLFDNFFYKRSQHWDFVLESLWKKDREWVVRRLIDAHASSPGDLTLIFEHAVNHDWLDELVHIENGFGIDLAAFAHSKGRLDLDLWAQRHLDNSAEMANNLMQFLVIKANFEGAQSAQAASGSTSLQVKTVHALFNIIDEFLAGNPTPTLIRTQRACITVYPRLINYGEGFDDIIDSNGEKGNELPPEANNRMEIHYKKMYGAEVEVREIVDTLRAYKTSQSPLDQDVFACMIHGLFDEFAHYKDYPVEALATTAVLFGGIISHKLISGLPLKIGLHMILEAVRDYPSDKAMFKFGFQALQTISPRFREWPAFAHQLASISNLRSSENWPKLRDALLFLEDHPHHGHEADAHVGFTENGEGSILFNSSPSRQLSQPFSSIHVDPPPAGVVFEDPDPKQQDKIQFLLNNVTREKLGGTSSEIHEILEHKYLQWFAGHLVEERAKMQPNYHNLYLDLVKILDRQSLWSEVLRETYYSVSLLLNSESTKINATERGYLKNLAGWLGLLTLARDKPVKHKNIAFKQLLLEAHHTDRLATVIPFVCKVLIQGASSNVFKPPNPWLMDIIHLLIAIYHEASIKLNLKFEIEVLCKGLNLDHRSIKPPDGILHRPSAPERPIDRILPDRSDGYDSIPINGVGVNGVGVGVPIGLTTQPVILDLPDISTQLQIPPTNEMVITPSRLHELVRTALTRSIADIIQPVVDRSVTIAAISTQQMILKDFSIEPDESRLRTSAINMVKSTAGSLALVTCKDPLRATFTNYMRQLSAESSHNLPEGTLLMCVNSNVDLGCSVIEKQAEDRAVPEIEEILEPEFEARRLRRAQKPMEPFVGRPLDRWASAIPDPYRLVDGMRGLTPEQMAIYEDFARHPRANVNIQTSHPHPGPEGDRSIVPETLPEQFGGSIAPATGQSEALNPSQSGNSQSYLATTTSTTRQTDLPLLANRFMKLLHELKQRILAAADLSGEHFDNLPRPHPIIDVYDALLQTIISVVHSSEELSLFSAREILAMLFTSTDSTLGVETYLSVLDSLRKMSSPCVNKKIQEIFRQQPPEYIIHRPMLPALLSTDLVDWEVIDTTVSQALQSRQELSLQLLEHILDLTLLSERPVILYANLIRTLEAAWSWIVESPENPSCQHLKLKLQHAFMSLPQQSGPDSIELRKDQMEYIFNEWVTICAHPQAMETLPVFLTQMQACKLLNTRDDLYTLLRVGIDLSVARFDERSPERSNNSLSTVDALAHLIITCSGPGSPVADIENSRPAFIRSCIAVIHLTMYKNHETRGERFSQRVFFRLLSLVLLHINEMHELMSPVDTEALTLSIGRTILDLGPRFLPCFSYGWIRLIQHRSLLPVLLQIGTSECLDVVTEILCQLLIYLGEQLKAPEVQEVSKDIYRATLKLLLVLQHDFPEYLAAYHNKLCRFVPFHCAQLLAVILAASPNITDTNATAHLGVRFESLQELRDCPKVAGNVEETLSRLGLLEVLERTLENGPLEDAVAHIAHAIRESDHKETAFGFVPVHANLSIIESVVIHIANFAIQRARLDGNKIFRPEEPDVKFLSMLIREVDASTRYFIIACIANQLRYPNSHTAYFSQLVLSIFGSDMADPDATEVRQQITRILLERLIPFWNFPWGILVTVIELLKNEAYMFFELPFIKSYPEVADRYAAVLRQ
ncbi:ccr4-not complex component [Ceratocystis lukuohia]|uniref:Ccr4-not complex component n=1 Tax=Ceratocystis lukuohia TaxID=2019550 RepID=A0ABR4MIP4_9PEZI